ncbi:MAG: hypothetical protein N3E36_04620 [Sulfolobales archaeon]|nr:hypothetical protein [Sulfolobales archaeon]
MLITSPAQMNDIIIGKCAGGIHISKYYTQWSWSYALKTERRAEFIEVEECSLKPVDSLKEALNIQSRREVRWILQTLNGGRVFV